MTNDNPNSSDHDSGDESQPTKQHPIASAIQSFEGTYKSSRANPTQYEREAHRWSIRTGKGVIAYTLLTAVIMAASIFTAIYSRQQANTAADTEAHDLRAYVYLTITAPKWPHEMTDERTGQIVQKPDRYGVTLNLFNSGKTWAQNIIVRKAFISETVDEDRWNKVDWKKPAEKPFVLGPNQHVELQFDNIWFRDLPSIARGSMGFHYYAWITYDNIFDAKVSPQTQLAQRVNANDAGEISFEYLPPHNCADDGCPRCRQLSG